jgi:cytochrome P450
VRVITAVLGVPDERRRQRPGDDLISRLLPFTELSFDQQWVTLASLLIGGHETTTVAIGNGVRQLLIHRRQFERITEQPSLAVTTGYEPSHRAA